MDEIQLSQSNFTLMLGLVDSETEKNIPYDAATKRFIKIEAISISQNKTIQPKNDQFTRSEGVPCGLNQTYHKDKHVDQYQPICIDPSAAMPLYGNFEFYSRKYV